MDHWLFHPVYRGPVEGGYYVDFNAVFTPMRSAYKEKQGKEPDTTNIAWSVDIHTHIHIHVHVHDIVCSINTTVVCIIHIAHAHTCTRIGHQ